MSIEHFVNYNTKNPEKVVTLYDRAKAVAERTRAAAQGTTAELKAQGREIAQQARAIGAEGKVIARGLARQGRLQRLGLDAALAGRGTEDLDAGAVLNKFRRIGAGAQRVIGIGANALDAATRPGLSASERAGAAANAAVMAGALVGGPIGQAVAIFYGALKALEATVNTIKDRESARINESANLFEAKQRARDAAARVALRNESPEAARAAARAIRADEAARGVDLRAGAPSYLDRF